MLGYLIKDTTVEERKKIVEESLGNISADCDGCMSGLAEMYQDYIEGKREIRDINMEFNFFHIGVICNNQTVDFLIAICPGFQIESDAEGTVRGIFA